MFIGRPAEREEALPSGLPCGCSARKPKSWNRGTRVRRGDLTDGLCGVGVCACELGPEPPEQAAPCGDLASSFRTRSDSRSDELWLTFRCRRQLYVQYTFDVGECHAECACRGAIARRAGLLLLRDVEIEVGMESENLSRAPCSDKSRIVPMYAIIVRQYFSPTEVGVRVGIVLMATLFGMALGGGMSRDLRPHRLVPGRLPQRPDLEPAQRRDRAVVDAAPDPKACGGGVSATAAACSLPAACWRVASGTPPPCGRP